MLHIMARLWSPFCTLAQTFYILGQFLFPSLCFRNVILQNRLTGCDRVYYSCKVAFLCKLEYKEFLLSAHSLVPLTDNCLSSLIEEIEWFYVVQCTLTVLQLIYFDIVRLRIIHYSGVFHNISSGKYRP